MKPQAPQAKRNFNPTELVELQEMIRLVNGRKWEASQVKLNTAMIPDGQRVSLQFDAVVMVLEGAKNHYVAQKLLECGYPEGQKCEINLTTGEIILQK